MKYFYTIIAVILGIAIFVGWRDHGEIATQQARRDRLNAVARELAIHPDQESAQARNRAGRGMDRINPQQAAAGKAYAAHMAALLREAYEGGEKVSGAEGAVQGIHNQIEQAAVELDGAAFAAIVLALRDSTDMQGQKRAFVLDELLRMKAEESPREVLALFGEVYQAMKEDDNGNSIICTTLAGLAAEDLGAALEWVRNKAKDYPGALSDVGRSRLLGQAARKDPKLAFQLLCELGIENPSEGISHMSVSVSTAGERQGLLESLRDYVGNADASRRADLIKSGLGNFGEKLTEQGFDKSAEWLNSANLSPEEKTAVAGGLIHWAGAEWTSADAGKWTDWVSANLPPEKASYTVAAMIGNWASRDFKAAADWLNRADPGPIRDEAVSHYAKALAPIEPAAAAGWAESLPGGKSRDEALQSVYSGWMKKDAAAARDFASKHGIR